MFILKHHQPGRYGANKAINGGTKALDTQEREWREKWVAERVAEEDRALKLYAQNMASLIACVERVRVKSRLEALAELNGDPKGACRLGREITLLVNAISNVGEPMATHYAMLQCEYFDQRGWGDLKPDSYPPEEREAMEHARRPAFDPIVPLIDDDTEPDALE